MELRELRSLILLSELGSIQNVAKSIGLTPGAIHKHLKMLEADLGVRLYEKRGRSLRLTPEGELVLPYLRDMITMDNAARRAATEWKESKRGIVRVGAGPSFCSHILPSILKKFRCKHPGIDIFIETGAGRRLTGDLSDGKLDLVFDLSTSLAEEPKVESAASWDVPAGFVANRPELKGRCSARDLESIPFILFQRASRMDDLIMRHLAELNIRPNVMMRSDSAEAIKAMVLHGMGVSILFLWTVAEELRSGSIRVIRVDGPELASRISLLRLKSSPIVSPIREFIELTRTLRWPYMRPVRL